MRDPGGALLVSPLLEEAPLGGGGDEALDDGVSLSVREVSYVVTLPRSAPWRRREAKVILDRISCSFAAGTATSIMGPSGSGKTSLLELIGGFNWNRGRVEGSVRARRRDGSMAFLSDVACLIPQDDVLLGGLTPRETFRYSAQLRGVGEDRVDVVLAKLGLLSCAETRVGSPTGRRGLSGGQRKRVSIGLELLTQPEVILCDEPTSGLDSKMALDVCAALVAMARDEGKTILCTIHQPSNKIHRLWHRHLLIANGRLAYDGDSIDAHFATELPSGENPAEVYMEWLQDDARADDLVDRWTREPMNSSSFEDNGDDDVDDDDEFFGGVVNGGVGRPLSKSMKKKKKRLKSYYYGGRTTGGGMWCLPFGARLRQASILARREAHDKLVDPEKWTATLTLKIFVGIIIGIVWIGQGDGKTQKDIFPVQGALFIVSVNSMMDVTFQTALALTSSRNLLLRELRNNHYTLFPRHVAVLAVDCVLAALSTLALGVPVAFLVGLRTDVVHFLRFVAIAVILAGQGVCFGHCVGTAADDFQQVQAIVSPCLTPLILFSGYMIPKKSIPYALKWVYDVSFFQYAVTNFNINEFRGKQFKDCSLQGEELGLCYSSGGHFLRANAFNPANFVRNYVILLAFWAFLATLSFIAYTRVIARH